MFSDFSGGSGSRQIPIFWSRGRTLSFAKLGFQGTKVAKVLQNEEQTDLASSY